MPILALDPGSEQSAWLVYDTVDRRPVEFRSGICPNGDIFNILQLPGHDCQELVIEKVTSYGMPVGSSVFDTVWWYGRFHQAWIHAGKNHPHYLTRSQVKMHICGQPRAKDANVRQALLDMWGDKAQAVGTKKSPGPLYGIKKDIWSALAVAITFAASRAS